MVKLLIASEVSAIHRKLVRAKVNNFAHLMLMHRAVNPELKIADAALWRNVLKLLWRAVENFGKSTKFVNIFLVKSVPYDK